jgi:general secretion pathway protein J
MPTTASLIDPSVQGNPALSGPPQDKISILAGPRAENLRSEGGFSMIEMLVALALLSVILTTLAGVTGQWIPNWKAGFFRLQKMEALQLGLSRAAADLAAAEFVSANLQAKMLLFEGTPSSVVFVRSAFEPNSRGELEVVRLRAEADGEGLVREAAPFAPGLPGTAVAEGFKFTGAVGLVRAPLKVSFAFSGRDRIWREAWTGSDLPMVVRVTVQNAASGEVVAFSAVTLVHVGAPAECVAANSSWGCIRELEGSRPPPTVGGAQF